MRKLSLICAVLVLLVSPSVLAKQQHQPPKHHKQHQQKPPAPVKPPKKPKPPTPPVVPVPPVLSVDAITLSNVYTTGYSSYDNTPKGSLEVDLDGISGNAGGGGTYANPTTLAVGHQIINGKDIGDFAYGTLFYVPTFQKYFSAQDSCGDGNSPQTQPCHDLKQAPKGATLWLDIWVGASSSSSVLKCEDNMTGLNTVIENPPMDLPVTVGNIC